MEVIAQRTVGWNNATNTTIVNRVHREGGEWIAVKAFKIGDSLNGAKRYKSKRAALKFLELEDGEHTLRLTAPWNATFVHGTTGQDVSEDTLTEGQYVRSVQSEWNQTAEANEYTALVSPDLKSWYRYRSFEQPFTR